MFHDVHSPLFERWEWWQLYTIVPCISLYGGSSSVQPVLHARSRTDVHRFHIMFIHVPAVSSSTGFCSNMLKHARTIWLSPRIGYPQVLEYVYSLPIFLKYFWGIPRHIAFLDKNVLHAFRLHSSEPMWRLQQVGSSHKMPWIWQKALWTSVQCVWQGSQCWKFVLCGASEGGS